MLINRSLRSSSIHRRAWEDRNLTKLDTVFWKKMGVLPLLDRLDESGKILPQEQHATQAEEEERDDETSENDLQTAPGQGGRL